MSRVELAERRAALAFTLVAVVERDADICAEIKNLTTKAKVQMAEIKATLRNIRFPVSI